MENKSSQLCYEYNNIHDICSVTTTINVVGSATELLQILGSLAHLSLATLCLLDEATSYRRPRSATDVNIFECGIKSIWQHSHYQSFAVVRISGFHSRRCALHISSAMCQRVSSLISSAMHAMQVEELPSTIGFCLAWVHFCHVELVNDRVNFGEEFDG